MSVFDVEIGALTGGPADLARYRGHALLVVNVASRCGLTPQYAGLQALADTYAGRGLVVLGVPCNQFAGQEPGTAGDIAEFCQATYGVTFPMTEKVDVKGSTRHPLFEELSLVPRAAGTPGDIEWNFEKFLIEADGTPVARFPTDVEPDDPRIREAIEYVLGDHPSA
jgi:glutathione peroxidase